MSIEQPKWHDMPAKNLGARGAGVKPKFIVLHDTANVGTHAETEYLAGNNDRGVSVCFTVEKDGSIWKLNPDLSVNYTFHAGRSTKYREYVNRDVNRYSIGIEICQAETLPRFNAYPQVQVDAVAQLCAWLCQSFGLTGADITTHANIITDGSRDDPRKFPFDTPGGFWEKFNRPRQGHYVPPPGPRARLGKICDLINVSPRILPNLLGLAYMAHLPGALYFESDLDLDTDGELGPGIHPEPTHQDHVAIGGVVDSNKVPYIVLPGGFYAQYGINIGDVALVFYGDKWSAAVFADVGPRAKIGEGSIALHRKLGYERIKANGYIQDVGIDAGVVTIVFARSGNGTVQTPEKIRTIALARFTELGGVLA